MPDTAGAAMKVAMFQQPLTPPGTPIPDVFRWAVDQAAVADEAGYTEYWVGEHSTQAWEAIPSPELIIAAAASVTSTIKLAPGAHLLPYHNPAALALRISWLTQLLEGRYILGVGAGAWPTDAAVHGITDMSRNHEMVQESLDIMHRIWKGEPFHFDGEFWSAGFPEPNPNHVMRDVRPYNDTVEIGVTGLSPNSSSMKFAGSRGYMPLSVYSGDESVRNHWSVYSKAAAEAGITVDRADHHVVFDAFVADTDKEAKRLAMEGGLGRSWNEYLIPVYKDLGIMQGLVKHPGMDPNDVDLNYIAEHVWLCGSPETVIEKFQAFQESTGGFGTFVMYNHEHIADPSYWNDSVRRIAAEVAPKIETPISSGGV